MTYIVAVSAALSLVVVYLLATAGAKTEFFSAHYPWLLGFNIGVGMGLIALIVYQGFRLRRQLKAKIFGARLRLKLVLLFASVILVPGVLVYSVSVQFLNSIIASWFDVRVEKALDGGMNLGRSAVDYLAGDLRRKGEAMSLLLVDSVAVASRLDNLREQFGVQEAALFGERGSIVAVSGGESSFTLPQPPGPTAMRQLRLQHSYTVVEDVPERGLYLRVVVPVHSLSLGGETRYLQLLQRVPDQLTDDMRAVRDVYRDYQELSLSRDGLKRISELTLTLTLLLGLLVAGSLAYLFSERLSAPLMVLARGTRNVAKGNFSAISELATRDELGLLTQSFNTMTRQLGEAREVAEHHQQQVEAAKIYVERILAHLSSGVVAGDQAGRVAAANPAACLMLGAPLESLQGRPFDALGEGGGFLDSFGAAVAQQFAANEGDWRMELESEASGRRVFMVRGTSLPEEADGGMIVVFDDITQLVDAQRNAAWAEVARRLAHEIKNPLTPIQLSAERLEHKLHGLLPEKEAEMLARATATIVAQVTAMKTMVDRFSEYARKPRLKLQTVDLSGLVREVAILYEPLVSLELDSCPAMVRADPTLLRQVIHNLLRNAQDALADVQAGKIRVATRCEEDGVVLQVADNGPGIPSDLMGRVFEPYLTTKPKGTGLGLAIVRRIVEEHEGRIRVDNPETGGAMATVWLPNAGSEMEDGEDQ